MTTLSFEGLSSTDIEAILAQVKAAKKTAKEAESARYAEMGRELVETLLLEQPPEASPSSARVGRSSSSLTIEVGGKTYTYYVSIKDVAATDARQKAIDAGEVVLVKATKKADDTEPEPTDPEPTEPEPTDPVSAPVSLVKAVA